MRPLTVGELIDFCEVWIHSLLYIRRVYPQSTFEKKTKFRIAVFKSKYSQLISYIRNVIDQVNVLKVEKLHVVLFDGNGTLVEKYSMHLMRIGVDVDDKKSKALTDVSFEKLESFFQGFLLRIHAMDSVLESLPEGCFFRIFAEYLESGESPSLQKGTNQWIACHETEISIPHRTMTSLRTQELGPLKVHLYIEEPIDRGTSVYSQ